MPPRPPKSQPFQAVRSIGLAGCAVAALGAGWYSSQLFFFIRSAAADEPALPGTAAAPLPNTSQADITATYNRTATSYDSSVDSFEYWSGITRLRRRLAGQARGRVLEAGVGTGRNIPFYNLHRSARLPPAEPSPASASVVSPSSCAAVESIVFVDTSRNMLDLAREKWASLYGRPGSDWARFRWASGAGRVRWWCGSAADGHIAAPTIPASVTTTQSHPDEQPPQVLYDTVIQTFALCSTPDPVSEIRNLSLLAHPDGGRVLLLEHGRGHYDWLNAALDKAAPAHAAQHGCWWNRDIGLLLRQSGVTVKSIKRRHLGTLWEVEIEPASWEARQKLIPPPTSNGNAEIAPVNTPTPKQWWNIF